jgi:very-short-patch-repair endonuclease
MGTDAARFSYMIQRQSNLLLPTDCSVWSRLKNRQGGRIQFHRQAIVGKQLVDLFCPAAKLVAELDAPEIGYETDAYLARIADIESAGASVIRFSSGQYSHCPDEISDTIYNECVRRVERRTAD